MDAQPLKALWMVQSFAECSIRSLPKKVILYILVRTMILFFQFHRRKANLRILEIEEVKSIPFTPISHPYVERVIGTIRRECLDQTLFWNEVNLLKKLDDFTDYYNNHCVHSSLNCSVPEKFGARKTSKPANLTVFGWQSFCRGLVQLPIPA